MKTSIRILLIVLLAFIASSQELYKKIVHKIDPQARCIDGSSPAIYLHEADPKNILFYFIGGADCAGDDLSSTLEHCYQRGKSMYGSSLYWPETKVGEGILSTDATKNIFANWTKVIILYCDGAFHQGNTKEPFSYKDTKLYFRGAVNTRSHFQYVHNRYNLSNADRVILSGSSAGGIATFIWANYLKAFIGNPETKFYSIVDSGIFLDPEQPLGDFDLTSSKSDQQSLFKVANRDEGAPNRACVSQQPSDREWYCLTTQGALPYLQTESLFIQSSYDQYIIKYFGHILCLTEGASGYSFAECSEQQFAVAEGYRSYYMQYLKKVTQWGHNIWTISCSWHATILFDDFYQSPLQKVPMETGYTMQEAIYQYVFEGQKVLEIDVKPWPSNTPCAY